MPHESPYPSVEIPERPYHELLLEGIDKTIRDGKNKIAFVSGEDPTITLTFEQLRKDAFAIATYLHSIGFKNDVAAVVLPNVFEYASFFIGCAINGGAISGASALFTDYELQRQFIDSRAKVVLTNEESLPKVLLAVKQSPNIHRIIVIPKRSGSSLPSGVVSWNDVVSTKVVKIPKVPIDVHNDLLVLPYSSGTTGPPKGVMLSHYNYNAMISVYLETERTQILNVLDKNWDDNHEKILLFLPFYHAYGFGLLNYSLLKGMTAVILNHFDPINFLTAIQNHKIRILGVVPPIMVFLAKHPSCDQFDLSSIQLIRTGAAPAGKDLIEGLMKKYTNLKYIQQGYGMTECTMASHLPDLNNDQPFGSVGKLSSNLLMKIVEPGTDKEQPVNQRGEICVRGPTVMLGYLGRPEATASTIIDGWLHTGDIGYINEDGNLFIVDRLKELIKVKGLQVPPAELEDLLLSHPKIRDCAVIGIPDAKAGELPKAFVVRADNTLSVEEVKDFVKSKVSAYKRLEGGVEFIEEIPKSAAGKILRRFLRDRSTAKL
uniref:4-coumarate--CoA ligase n=1 Tax=Caenorhabditis tropicalis TaxID=1561998 RepID=A0A1I7U7V2_9PELO